LDISTAKESSVEGGIKTFGGPTATGENDAAAVTLSAAATIKNGATAIANAAAKCVACQEERRRVALLTWAVLAATWSPVLVATWAVLVATWAVLAATWSVSFAADVSCPEEGFGDDCCIRRPVAGPCEVGDSGPGRDLNRQTKKLVTHTCQ
jgi:hypothetical protein